MLKPDFGVIANFFVFKEANVSMDLVIGGGRVVVMRQVVEPADAALGASKNLPFTSTNLQRKTGIGGQNVIQSRRMNAQLIGNA